MKGYDLLKVINLISEEKKISSEIVINSIKEGFVKSYEKKYPESICKVDIDCDDGKISLYRGYKIIDDVELADDNTIMLEDALLILKDAKVDEVLYKEVDSSDFNRTAISQVSQILRQQLREAEKKSIYEEYKDKIGEIMSGKIVTIKESYCLIEIGRTFAFLPRKHMLENDNYTFDDIIKFYVEDINEKSKNSGQILASRTNKNFLIKLLEQEIPEIFEGIVKIVDIVRNPGIRSKISVYSENQNIDPVGTCVGVHGSRIKKITEELNGENIDVCKWSENRLEYIENIFSLVNILHVEVHSDKEITIIVPNDQLSLAIGKQGRTIKLCANMLNVKINVLKIEDPRATRILEMIESKSANDNYEDNYIETANDLIEVETTEKSVVNSNDEVEMTSNLEQNITVKAEKLSEEMKNSFLKYQNEFNNLTSKIRNLNHKKYDNVEYAKEIKIKFIDLYEYFNDYDAKTITVDIFNKIQEKISLKELKKYSEFVDNYDLSNEDLLNLNQNQDNNLASTDKKVDVAIEEELNFYSEVENQEQELDNEFYDNIDYDDYDEYYD